MSGKFRSDNDWRDSEETMESYQQRIDKWRSKTVSLNNLQKRFVSLGLREKRAKALMYEAQTIVKVISLYLYMSLTLFSGRLWKNVKDLKEVLFLEA